MKTYNLGFTGSRPHYWQAIGLSPEDLHGIIADVFTLAVLKVFNQDLKVHIHVGDAQGVDHEVIRAALHLELPVTVYHPFENPRFLPEIYQRGDLIQTFRVNTHGNLPAGQQYAIRDKYMVGQCDGLVAIHAADSKGTRLTIDEAINQHKPVRVYTPHHRTDLTNYTDY